MGAQSGSPWVGARCSEGRVAEELQLGLRAQAGTEQVDDLGNDQGRNDQRSRMGLQQLRTRLVVLVVGIDVGVERTRVNDDSYGVTSLPKISSIRSEMSCRPLRPAAFAPSTRRPGVPSPRSSSSARPAGTIAASRRPWSVR